MITQEMESITRLFKSTDYHVRTAGHEHLQPGIQHLSIQSLLHLSFSLTQIIKYRSNLSVHTIDGTGTGWLDTHDKRSTWVGQQQQQQQQQQYQSSLIARRKSLIIISVSVSVSVVVVVVVVEQHPQERECTPCFRCLCCNSSNVFIRINRREPQFLRHTYHA